MSKYDSYLHKFVQNDSLHFIYVHSKMHFEMAHSYETKFTSSKSLA